MLPASYVQCRCRSLAVKFHLQPVQQLLGCSRIYSVQDVPEILQEMGKRRWETNLRGRAQVTEPPERQIRKINGGQQRQPLFDYCAARSFACTPAG